jgi:asparagine synthase (glutamine-hydrolysing)
MCGIAGWVDGGVRAAAPDDEQLDVLRHRGPDARAWFNRGPGAVGQTRLAVIDLVTGDPPITNEDGQVGVALNGEVYNFQALRSMLAAEGHRFMSACDTEVIAHLAEARNGCEVATALEGMFAAAIWDHDRRRLTLLRDRIGKKPLYYWTDGTRLVFGSEIKALLAHPLVPRRLNPRAIPAYLTFGYVPTPETFFEGIVSVPPGHALTYEPDRSLRLERYWAPPCPGVDVPHLDLTGEEVATELRSRLRSAVARRLVADVPLGAFLSGGIDSTAVVGLMSELVDRPVRTFTIGFEDVEGFDERIYAGRVAERFRTEHVEFVVRPAAVDLIERLVWHYDQPFGDSSAVPTFLLSELTRQHVTVALAGDGGDELFAGYERFAAALLLQAYGRLPFFARDLLRRGSTSLPTSAFSGRAGGAQRFVARANMPLPDAYLSWLSYVDESTRHALLIDPHDWAIDHYRELWKQTDGAAHLDRLLSLNLQTYLLDDLLPKVDRMSMAHGLEVRSPFLDRELIEFAMRIPPSLKIRGPRLKYILKRAVEDLIPVGLLNRRKRGFGVPIARWFRSDLASYVDSTLGAGDARIRQHLAGEVVTTLIQEHRSRRRDHAHALWALLTLEVFLRREGW